MVWAREHVSVVVVCATSFLFILTCVSTTAWMKGCMSSENFLREESYEAGGKNDSTTLDNEFAMFRGTKTCIRHGLFRVAMVIGGIMNLGLHIPVTSMPAYSLIAAIALISAAGFIFAAIVLHVMVANGTNDTYQAKSRSTQLIRLAIILLICATLLAIGGMVAYVGGTAHIVHQPYHFLAQFGESFVHLVAQDAMEIPSRRRRDLDISGLGGDAENYMKNLVKGMDPVYSYSFFLGWVGIVINVVALFVTVIVKQRLLKRRHAEVPVDL